jgi:crotonobetainyl-CoA:carnitine CoA-transferase CaiB-like acyl-CoA transferase
VGLSFGEKAAGEERIMPNNPQKPGALDGIRVIELSALIAGPSCARYLADHGAEVIKIERFPDGDVARVSDRAKLPRAAMYVAHNGGKKGLCLDLTQPDGLAVARDLIAKADVVIEAFTPGVMKRLGLGFDDCKTLNPKLVMCSISGFGQTGPNANRPGYAHIAHSMTGWLAMQFLHHNPPQTPRGPGIAIADVITGISAFGAICAALFKRERTGEGEYIDIALFDSLFAANDMSLQNYLITGEISVFHHPVHKTKDGYLTANVGPDFRAWQNVCKAMGKEELLQDPRFSSHRAVLANRDAATAEVRGWLSTLTTEEAEKRLVAHHVVTGVVKTLDQAARQPQVLARELITELDDPVLGHIDVVNSSIKYLNSEARVRGPAPMLGEHNADVLSDVLGYSNEKIAALRDKGILQSAEK